MSFTITATNGAHLLKQVERFTATLPEGNDFPINFAQDPDGTWWVSYQGQMEGDRMSFRSLVGAVQKMVEDREASIAMAEDDGLDEDGYPVGSPGYRTAERGHFL